MTITHDCVKLRRVIVHRTKIFFDTEGHTEEKANAPWFSAPVLHKQLKQMSLGHVSSFPDHLPFCFSFPVHPFLSFRRFDPSIGMMHGKRITKFFVGLMKTSHHYFLHSIRTIFFIKLWKIKVPCKQISAPIVMTSPTRNRLLVQQRKVVQLSFKHRFIVQNFYSWTGLRPSSAKRLRALYDNLYFLISPSPLKSRVSFSSFTPLGLLLAPETG